MSGELESIKQDLQELFERVGSLPPNEQAQVKRLARSLSSAQSNGAEVTQEELDMLLDKNNTDDFVP